MGPLLLLGGVVVPYEAAGDGVVKDVIRYRVKDNFVNECRGLD